MIVMQVILALPLLENAIDRTFVEWKRKPVAFVGWGDRTSARNASTV